jgi:hypothetical protein
MKRKLERRIPEGYVEAPAPAGVFIGSTAGRLDRVMSATISVFIAFSGVEATKQANPKLKELLHELRYQIERLTDRECQLLNIEPLLLRIERIEWWRQLAIRWSLMGWARRCSDAIHEQSLLINNAVMDLRVRDLCGDRQLRNQPSETMLVPA